MAWEQTDFRSMARSCGLEPQTALSGVPAQNILPVLSQPSEPHWKMRFKGGFQDLFFLTTLDKTPLFAGSVCDLAKLQGYPAESVGVYIQPIVQGTSCHCEFSFYFDPANAEMTIGTRKMVEAGSADIGQRGGFFSRPYPPWKEIAYRNSPATVAMQKKIKAIFDPKGILNPGKLCF